MAERGQGPRFKLRGGRVGKPVADISAGSLGNRRPDSTVLEGILAQLQDPGPDVRGKTAKDRRKH